MPTADRRDAARTLQRFLVRYEDEGEMRLAFTENVSDRGLFLRTRFPPPPGTGLRLLIRTARGAHTVRGRVVWTRHNMLAPRTPRLGSGAGIRLLAR